MADPTPYTRSFSFTGYQTATPQDPLPGPQVDVELDTISGRISEIVDAVKDVRRSDGALGNGLVTADALSPTIQAELIELAGAAGDAVAAQVHADRLAAEAAAGNIPGQIQGYLGYTPEMFGANGTAAGDMAAFNALKAVAPCRIFLQPRDYLLPQGGFQGVSGMHFIGVPGKTKIKCSVQMTGVGADVFYFGAASNFSFTGVIFDGNGFTAGTTATNYPGTPRFTTDSTKSRYPGTLPLLHISSCTDWVIRDCEFINYDTHGILVNQGAGQRGLIEGVKTVRATRERLYPNYGIGVIGEDLVLRNVKCINGGIAGWTVRSWFISCRVEGWAMGAAFNQASVGDGLSGDNVYLACTATDSNRAQDLDDYSPGGFEIFSPRTKFIGCKSIRAFGSGFYMMAPGCDLIGCEALDNGAPTYGGVGFYLLREVGTNRGADHNTLIGCRATESGSVTAGAATISIASPALVTKTAHGFQNGSRVIFNTAGTLPTGITAGTIYFVRDATANTFHISTTEMTTSLVTTSGTQAGAHTVTPFRSQEYGYLEQAGAALAGVRLDATCRFSGNINANRQYDGTGTQDPNAPMFAYVPTVTAEAGAFSNATAVGSFQKIGSKGRFRVTITVGASGVGSAATGVVFTLPWQIVSEAAVSGYERNNGLGGLYGRAVAGTNTVNVKTVANGFPGTNNSIIIVSGEVEVAPS